jgi:hypothetical protein
MRRKVAYVDAETSFNAFWLYRIVISPSPSTHKKKRVFGWGPKEKKILKGSDVCHWPPFLDNLHFDEFVKYFNLGLSSRM